MTALGLMTDKQTLRLAPLTEVLEEIPQADQATAVKLDDSELPGVKTLGVHWNVSDNVFTFIVKEINPFFYTRWGLLSRIATLFDPLLFLAPYIIRAEMALQEPWLRGHEWDEEFAHDLKLTTHQWARQLPEAPQVKIPHSYQHHEEAVEDVSLQTFVDASGLAYAIYRDSALYTFLNAVEHDLLKLKPAPVRDNLTTCEWQACKMLSRRNDIVIKSADKGSGTVVLDRDSLQLNDTSVRLLTKWRPFQCWRFRSVEKRI